MKPSAKPQTGTTLSLRDRLYSLPVAASVSCANSGSSGRLTGPSYFILNSEPQGTLTETCIMLPNPHLLTNQMD